MQIPKLVDSHFRQALFIHGAHSLFVGTESRLRAAFLVTEIRRTDSDDAKCCSV